jgi:hypothetical protein
VVETNELEPAYHYAAKAVLSREAIGPADIFRKLKTIYVENAKFERDFTLLEAPTRGQKKKLAKYILCRLESERSGRFCDPETEPATIEHVLPENPTEEWEDSIPRDKWDNAVYRLGNLALLAASVNREIGNASYGKKVDAYRQSAYAITSGIAEAAPEQWSLEYLGQRQERMAAMAARIWRSDFDD